jgi:hypothetical protein
MFDPNDPEPLCPEHSRDELLCGLLREAIAAWDRGTALILWNEDGSYAVSRLMLTRDWYEAARDAVGD